MVVVVVDVVGGTVVVVVAGGGVVVVVTGTLVVVVVVGAVVVEVVLAGVDAAAPQSAELCVGVSGTSPWSSRTWTTPDPSLATQMR